MLRLRILIWTALLIGGSAESGAGEPIRLMCSVMDTSREPIAGVAVEVRSTGLGILHVLASGETDARGVCVFADLTPAFRPVMDAAPPLADERGSVWLVVTARAPGYATRAIHQGLMEGANAGMSFWLTPAAELRGRLCDELGQPLARAHVVALNTRGPTDCLFFAETMTEEGGEFRLEGVPAVPGPRFALWAARAGEEFAPLGESSLTPDPLAVQMPPRSARVHGEIDWRSRRPLPVFDVWLGDNLNGLRAWHTRADIEGSFEFTALPCGGRYEGTAVSGDLRRDFHAEATRGESWPVRVAIAPPGETWEPSASTARCPVTVHVVDEEGHPRAGFLVSALLPAVAPFGGLPFGQTSGQGTVTAQLASGVVTIWARSVDAGVQDLMGSAEVTVVDSPPTDVTITLRQPSRFSVTGRVIDPGGCGVPGVLVRQDTSRIVMDGEPNARTHGRDLSAIELECARLVRDRNTWPVTTTDGEGRFSLEFFDCPHAWKIRLVSDTHRVPDELDLVVTPESGTLEFTALPRLRLHAQPISASGEPARRFVHDFFTPSPSTAETGWGFVLRREPSVPHFTAYPVSRELGAVVTLSFPEVAYGHRVLLLTRSDVGEVTSAEFDLGVSGGQSVDLGRLAMTRGVDLSGRVLDTEGQPVAGARVALEGANGQSLWRGEWLPLWAETQTDGSFTLKTLPRGTWRFTITADGFETTAFEMNLPTEEPVRWRLSRHSPSD